jgi:hypothetical protein
MRKEKIEKREDRKYKREKRKEKIGKREEKILFTLFSLLYSNAMGNRK